MTQIASLLGGGPKPNKISGQTPALFKPKPSEKTVNTVNKIKKKFDPQTMSNAMGKPLGDDTVNKLTGQDDKKDPIKVAPNSGKKVGKLDTANYSSISEDQKQRMRKGDGVADVVAKVINFMKSAREQTKTQRELTRDFKKEEHEKEKRAHESLLRQIKGDREPEEQSLTRKGATLEKVSKIGAKEHPELAQRVAQTNATPAYSGHPIQNFGGPKPKEGVLSSVAKFAVSTTSRGVSAVSRGIGSVLKGRAGAIAAGVATGAVLGGSSADVIAAEEGLPKKGKAYWDPPSQRNLVSIGYGHQIKAEEYKQGFIMAGDEKVPIQGERGIDTVMTPEQSKKLLSLDLPKYEKAASAPLGDAWGKLDDKQKAALVSYAYNTGSTQSLVKQGLVEAINKGDIQGAAKIIEDRGIKTSGGVLNPVLVDRRSREAALFATGKMDTASASSTPEATTGQQLNKVSTENSDMKKDSDGDTLALVNNSTVVNNTIRPKTVNIVQRTPMSDAPQLLQNKLSYV